MLSFLETGVLLSQVNPSNAEATFIQSTRMQRFWHVGIHWKALAEYSQMSTYMPGFRSFFRFFASFCVDKISHQQHKVLKEFLCPWLFNHPCWNEYKPNISTANDQQMVPCGLSCFCWYNILKILRTPSGEVNVNKSKINEVVVLKCTWQPKF